MEIAKSYNVAYVSPPEPDMEGDAIDLLAIDPPWNGNDDTKPRNGGGGGGTAAPVQPFQYPAASAPVCKTNFKYRS